MRPIRKLLIANRGEIALRIAGTARRMGIRTVAVYSDADRHAAFVRACDEAVHIGAAAARDSYLNADRLLAAARSTGADAIHPGYGFLSENDVFAEQVKAAGLVFVGPPPAAIAAMGSKSAAKKCMADAGVPLVPGYHGADQDDALLHRQADAIGYPVLIKASAGGGGKGMRIVRSSDEFIAALHSCRREARNAFADDQVLIEKYLERSRHVEVQVFADTHGNTVHLFERDCSVQRRHQKVIEEAPAPGLTVAQRDAMGAAAVAAAKAVGYVGAGTVEFIFAPDGAFYFMEMNTRLQVEHPVTEMITGLDLVALQLRIASGEPMPFAQEDLRMDGHAIELRLYAENADQGFLPSIGKLQHVRWPEAARFVVNSDIAGNDLHYRGRPVSLRLDAGVGTGDEISSHYDPMIGKLIAWAPSRQGAIDRLVQALGQLQVVGVHTNAGFLSRLLRDDAFRSADLDTALIARRHAQLQPDAQIPAERWILAAAAVEQHLLKRDTQPVAAGNSLQAGWTDPWQSLVDWRLHGRSERQHVLAARGVQQSVQWQSDSSDTVACVLEGGTRFSVRVLPDSHSGFMSLEIDGNRYRANAVWQGASLYLFEGAEVTVFERVFAKRTEESAQGGGLRSPMPGKVLTLLASPGQAVKAGDPLLVMEAMKMEHTVCAPRDGTLGRFLYAAGDTVAEGVPLLELEPEQ